MAEVRRQFNRLLTVATQSPAFPNPGGGKTKHLILRNFRAETLGRDYIDHLVETCQAALGLGLEREAEAQGPQDDSFAD